MKNKFFLFFLVAFVLGEVSHLDAQSPMFAGAKGSYSLTTIKKSDAKSYSYMSGYSAGLFFDYKVDKLYGATVEINFQKKGARDIDMTLFYSPGSPYLSDRLTKADVEFRTIEAPLLFNFYAIQNEPVSLKVFLGPSFEYIIGAKSIRYMEYTTPLGQVAKYHDAADIKERLNLFDIGGVGGIGADIDLKPLHVSIDARYRMGFMDVNNVAGRPDFTSRGFQIVAGIGYAF